MSNSSIWSINRTLSGSSTPSQHGSGSNSNEGVLCSSQSSSITGPSPWDCLVSYQGHSLGESYLSAEVQLVYSAAPVDWAILKCVKMKELKVFLFFLNKCFYVLSCKRSYYKDWNPQWLQACLLLTKRILQLILFWYN